MMKVVVVILSAVLSLGSFKSAKALGLSIPPSLLLQAEQAIE